MVKVIDRNSITADTYREILDVEVHHNHPIIEDDHGTLRWEANPSVRNFIDTHNLNDIIIMLRVLGYDKNSEIYRKLYRDMGYSLYGYWEIFYWEANNDAADKYVPKKEVEYSIFQPLINNFTPSYTKEIKIR